MNLNFKGSMIDIFAQGKNQTCKFIMGNTAFTTVVLQIKKLMAQLKVPCTPDIVGYGLLTECQKNYENPGMLHQGRLDTAWKALVVIFNGAIGSLPYI